MGSPSEDARNSGRWMSRSAILLADQGLNSLTNIVVTVLVAREASLQQFGVFATVQFAVVLGQTVSIGAIADPWLQAKPEERAPLFATGLAALRTAALAMVVLGLAVVATLGLSAVVIGLVALPAIAGLDYVRAVLFAEGRLRTALAMDGAFGALQLVCIGGWIAFDAWRGAAGAWLAWAAAAYAVFAIFALGAVRVQPVVGREERAPLRCAFRARYAAEALVLAGGAQLSLLIVTARLGVTFGGLFRITQIPFGPLIVLLQAGRALLIPAFGTANRRRGWRLFSLIAGVYTVLCVGFTALTYAVTESPDLRALIGGVHPPPDFVFLTGLLFLTAGLHLLVFFYFRARQWDSAVTFSRVVLLAMLLATTIIAAVTASSTVFFLLTSLTWLAATSAMAGYQSWVFLRPR